MNHDLQQQDQELASLEAKLSESERDRAALRSALQTEEFSDTADVVLQFVRINSKIADWATMASEHLTERIGAENVRHPTLEEMSGLFQSQTSIPIPSFASSDELDIENLIYMHLSQFLAEAMITEIFAPFHPCLRNKRGGDIFSNTYKSIRQHGRLNFLVCLLVHIRILTPSL